MSYQDAREMRKDLEKNPKKALKNILFWILSLLVVGILSIIYSQPIKNLFSSQKPDVTQSTTGNQSSNIKDADNVTINYNNIVNSTSDLEQLKANADKGKTYTLEETIDLIREIQKERTVKSTEKEAELEFEILLSTLPFKLEESERKKKQYKNHLDALPDACDRVFKGFVIPFIDAFFKSHSSLSNNPRTKVYGLDLIKVEIIADIDVLFDEKCDRYPIRIIRFPGSSFIRVFFNPGAISEDQISCYPGMIFHGLTEENIGIKGARLDIHKSTGRVLFGGGGMSFPTPNENGELDANFYRGLESFKKAFKDRFNKLIVKMIEHGNQG